MSDATILLIEKDNRGTSTFDVALQGKGYAVARVAALKEALSKLHALRPDLVVLNAASLGSSGVRMCQRLRQSMNGFEMPLILIAPQGKRPNVNGHAQSVLVQPFTERKLINRIIRLLPGKQTDELQVGPIRLDPVLRVVRVGKRSTHLTPRAAHLLEILMRRQGVVVRREELMQRVWQTDYMGDTRTLDVHVSWLRKAIEDDPRKPRFLKTLRGLGYRLDMPKPTR